MQKSCTSDGVGDAISNRGTPEQSRALDEQAAASPHKSAGGLHRMMDQIERKLHGSRRISPL